MNIDKHIVIKDSGVLIYSNLSPVYKEKGTYCLDDNGYCGDDIIFNPSVEVKWKYSEISIMGEIIIVKKVEFEYDFGMPMHFQRKLSQK